MIQLVHCCCLYVLFATLAINANPVVENETVNFAAESRRIVQENEYASLGRRSALRAKYMGKLLILKTVAIEPSGDIFFYIHSAWELLDTKDDKTVVLIYPDEDKPRAVQIVGTYKKVKEGSDEYTRGKDAYKNVHMKYFPLPQGELFKVDILNITFAYKPGQTVIKVPVSLEAYSGGTDGGAV